MCEIAWAAGFFDGEGHSGLHRNTGGKRPGLRLHVTQKDPVLLLRFHEAVGGKGYVVPDGPLRWRWWAYTREAEEVMELLWPYLGAPKKLQWLQAKEAQPPKKREWNREEPLKRRGPR